MSSPFPSPNPFSDKTVLVTGHTGFKGSWLSIWLRELGARVMGFSLPEPPTQPSNFQVCGLAQRMLDVRGDVRDFERLCELIATHRPQVIFHLAAQPLVLRAYEAPREAYEVNVMGTVNLLEAVRRTNGGDGALQAIVCVTTDKVYENREWVWGYRETDHLGGHDPYSAGKAMAELAIASYRRSFFPGASSEGGSAGREQAIALASARAGNVIGGGDFAANRLLPDCMRALMAGEPIVVRNPHHVRPWQHVLESLSGYLTLAARLMQDGPAYAEAWNFAPQEAGGVTALMVVEKVIELWGSGEWVQEAQSAPPPKETTTLRLNWDKAANRLGWRPVYTWEEALKATVEWYRWFQKREPQSEMYDACVAQIVGYVERKEIGD